MQEFNINKDKIISYTVEEYTEIKYKEWYDDAIDKFRDTFIYEPKLLTEEEKIEVDKIKEKYKDWEETYKKYNFDLDNWDDIEIIDKKYTINII